MLTEQRRFRKSLFFVGIAIELVFIAIKIQNGFGITWFDYVYALLLLLLLRPFDFLKESVELRDDHVVRMIRGHVAEMLPLNEIVSVQGRSFLGMIPYISLIGKHSRMDIPLVLLGALDLEKKINPEIDQMEVLHPFFNHYRTLFSQHKELWNSMTEWVRWYMIFGIISPLFIWGMDETGTLYWMLLSIVYVAIVVIMLKVLHHLVLTFSDDWGCRYLPVLRFWSLFIAFLLYLLQGIRFNMIT